MPRPTETMSSAARQIHRARGFAERLVGACADLRGVERRRECLDRRRPRFHTFGAKGAGLQRGEHRRRARQTAQSALSLP